ncbi:unnamed protein product [Closterium sp. NIES-65]|nr:unnamed protein product [Closterium sp. NIES-65]
MAAEISACSSLELPQRISRTHPTEDQSDAPLPTPTSVSAALTAPPASPMFTQPPLEFPLPAVEFSLRELAACTRGFGPDAMLAMDWAGAVYRGCCHVGKGHVVARRGGGLQSEEPAKEAPRGSPDASQAVTERGASPADLCCCATCQELTATKCVNLRGGCARVKRWRYLPSSLPPPPSTSAAADATGSGSTSNEQGPTALDSMPSHTPEEAQSSGDVDSSVSAGREMMGRLAEAAALHTNLLPIVGFSCLEELLLVFRSNPSARSLEYALARDAMLCGAGSPSALSSWSARLSIARQMAGGLAHLHSHSFLHASLRPANVLLHAVGSTQRCSSQLPSHLSDHEKRWWRHLLRRKARAETAAQVRVQLADYGMPCQARDGQGLEGKSLGCVVFGDAKYLDPAFMGSGRPVWSVCPFAPAFFRPVAHAISYRLPYPRDCRRPSVARPAAFSSPIPSSIPSPIPSPISSPIPSPIPSSIPSPFPSPIPSPLPPPFLSPLAYPLPRRPFLPPSPSLSPVALSLSRRPFSFPLPSLPSPFISPVADPLSRRPSFLPSPILSPVALYLSRRLSSLPSPFPSPVAYPLSLETVIALPLSPPVTHLGALALAPKCLPVALRFSPPITHLGTFALAPKCLQVTLPFSPPISPYPTIPQFLLNQLSTCVVVTFSFFLFLFLT